MNTFWKILIIANLIGLISVLIYTSDKNNYLADKVIGLEQIDHRLVRETQALKTTNRNLVEVLNKLKFRIERLEFERGQGLVEDTELLQYGNINFEDGDKDLESEVPSFSKSYRFNMEDGYCDMARDSIITLVASGLGELIYTCNNK